jgi:hypothetical protein
MIIAGNEATQMGTIWLVKNVRPDEVGSLIRRARAELADRLIEEPHITQHSDEEFWVSFHLGA